MELGDGPQPRVVGRHHHHLNNGATGLSLAVQQVMAGALGAPAAGTEFEKAEGVCNWIHGALWGSALRTDAETAGVGTL